MIPPSNSVELGCLAPPLRYGVKQLAASVSASKVCGAPRASLVPLLRLGTKLALEHSATALALLRRSG